MTPSDIILRKALAASGIPSSDWEAVRAGLRDRAFFSARVQSLRFLHAARARTASLLQAARRQDGAFETRASAVSAVMAAARAEGLGDGSGRITDHASAARAALIVGTNAGLAAGHSRHASACSPGALAAFPGQELIRIRPARNPRSWKERWAAAGGTLRAGRMAALLTDPVWTRISRFGTPYPPFDYNSGMGVRSLPRSECLSLGLITEDWRPPATSLHDDFNASLTATLDFGHWTDTALADLRDHFRDQIQEDQHPDGSVTVTWRAHVIRDAFRTAAPGNGSIVKLGKASRDLLAATPDELLPIVKGTGLSVTKELITHAIADGHWPEEKSGLNLPLEEADLDLIPLLWRSPDRVTPGNKKSGLSFVLEIDLLTGGTLTMPIRRSGGGCIPLSIWKAK